MTILAIDTTHQYGSVALSMPDGEVYGSFLDAPSKHAEQLISAMESLLAEHQLDYQLLDAVAVSVGPGSFTGVRMGLATMRGIRQVTQLPIIGVGSLDAVHYCASLSYPQCSITVLIDARRGQFFMRRYDAFGHARGDSVLIDSDKLCDLSYSGQELLIGSIPQSVTESLPEIRWGDIDLLPDAEMVVRYGRYLYAHGNTGMPPQPLYIRPPDANLPL